MKAVLKLERIGDDYFYARRHKSWTIARLDQYRRRLGPDKSPSWLARLYPDGRREFLRGTLDYSRANSCGSRGIFEYFPLSDGVYEVNDRYKWNKVQHYFIRVESGIIAEISREEAMGWQAQNINADSE